MSCITLVHVVNMSPLRLELNVHGKFVNISIYI